MLCSNCGDELIESDAFFDDDDDVIFCSSDCRRQFRQDLAADRAAEMADAWD